MSVLYYGTDFGIFTLIADDAVYSAVVDDASARDSFPWADVVCTLAINTENYSAESYLTFTDIVNAAVLKQVNAEQSSLDPLTEYYNLDSTRRVKMSYGYWQNPADLRFNNWLYIENAEVTNLYANAAPYGRFTAYTSGASRATSITLEVFLANSDLTLFKYVRLIVRGTAATYKFGGAFSVANSRLQAFFTDLPPYNPGSTDPYGELDGESDITGGGVGTVNIPGFPGLTATSTGIIGLFAPSAAQMQALASYMWTDFGGTGTTTEDILKEIVEALKRSISNPLDYIIGLNIIPSQGLSIGASSVIRFGFVSSGVSMPRLSDQYFTVDCGSLDFDPICGDTFLDYAPYSKFSIYLPYIGVKDVDANDFVGHTIGVVYHGDTVTGGVTAYITKDGSVMYQYSGCCALNIPLSADNWGNTISGAVQIATSIVGTAVSGGAAGIAQAAVSGVASVAANPSMLSPQVAHSGAVSGGAGCMAVQYPFVIREAVRFHSTEYFNTLAGYPSFYYRSLADVSGYTKVLEIHLRGMTATQEEITEIETILKQGAIF